MKLDTTMSEINRETIRAMRLSYGQAGLSEGDLATDPIQQFKKWLGEASENIMIVEANAMVLATVTDQVPISRTVLLKDVSEAGFTFFTNYLSRKARAMNILPPDHGAAKLVQPQVRSQLNWIPEKPSSDVMPNLLKNILRAPLCRGPIFGVGI